MAGKVILISGACGTGKSTVSRILARGWGEEFTVHLHTDDFYQYIQRGYRQPWEAESGDQNEVVMACAVACAEQFALGGYQVFVDGVVGPWFLPPWRALAERGIDLRYVVLRPEEQEAIARAAQREQRPEFPLDFGTVSQIWRSLADLGDYEPHAVDTTGQTPEESAAHIRRRLEAGEFGLR